MKLPNIPAFLYWDFVWTTLTTACAIYVFIDVEAPRRAVAVTAAVAGLSWGLFFARIVIVELGKAIKEYREFVSTVRDHIGGDAA